MKTRKSNKGMTLVEIMVNLAIVSIIIAAVGSVFLLALQYLTHFGEQRNTKIMIDSIAKYFVTQLTDATDVCISNSADVPETWSDTDETYLCFTQDGKIITNVNTEFFGEDFYNGGSVKCNITLPVDSEKVNLGINIAYYDKDGELGYERSRTFNIINLTTFERNVSLKGSISNESMDVYVHYRKQPEELALSPEGDEYKIWSLMETLFQESIAKENSFYQHSQTLIADNDKSLKVTPINLYAVLQYQYRLSARGAGWTNSNKVQELLILDADKISQIVANNSLESMLTGRTQNAPLYMVTYHYYKNQSACDLMFYTSTSYSFDNIKGDDNMKSYTNMIYNNDNNTWYYFEVGKTKGTVGTVTKLESHPGFSIGSKSTDRIPVCYDSTLSYTDSTGKSYTATIESGYQIKQFFVNYGQPLIMNQE